MHPHRTDVVDMVTSQWYADLLGIPRKGDVNSRDYNLKDPQHVEETSTK